MATYYAQDCPLCSSSAEYCYVDAGNRKYFKCPTCTYFQISWRAEDLLLKKTQTFKSTLVEMAPQAPQGSLLTVLMRSATELEHEGALEVAYVSKSELPLNCE